MPHRNSGKIKSIAAAIVAIFVISGIATGVFVNYIFPWLSGVAGLRLLNPRFPVVVNRTEEVRLNESIDTHIVYERMRGAAVTILSTTGSANPFDRSFIQPSAGAGFIVTGDGLIFASKRTIGSPASNVKVFTDTGGVYAAQIISFDYKSDLALIKIQGENLPILSFSTSAPTLGDKMITVGASFSAFDRPMSVAMVTKSAATVALYPQIRSSEENAEFMQLDRQFGTDFAGAPLVDRDGRVAGMLTSGGVLPSAYISDSLTKYFAGGNFFRGRFGVRYAYLTPGLAAMLGLSQPYGALIFGADGQPGIEAGSAAERGGLREGDFIYKINGKALDASYTFEAAVNQLLPGATAEVDYLRGGQPATASVVVVK